MIYQTLLFLLSRMVMATIVIHDGLSLETQNATVIHRVAVGQEGSPSFLPDRLNANIGDQIIFDVYGMNHSVTRSSLESPCTSLQQFDTGFGESIPCGKNGLSVTFTVNTLEPQWFFCRQAYPNSHCHTGMIFALNPGSHMDKFQRNAQRTARVSSSSMSSLHIGPQNSPSRGESISSTHKPRPSSSSSAMDAVSTTKPAKLRTTIIFTKTVTTTCSSRNTPTVTLPTRQSLLSKPFAVSTSGQVKRSTSRASKSSEKLSSGIIQGLRRLAVGHLLFLFV